MSGDYSRRRFDPQKHYASVLMQQGRVQLDADWNEMAELFERRFRAERVDTFGRVAVPRIGPGDANNTLAFRLAFKAGALQLGRGRIYVDGLLVENHGRLQGQPVFDPVLDELRGDDDLPLTEQPYFPPGTPLPPPDRPFAVYLDVWRREVTALEDPGLVEPAVGVDTTTRTQVAWQARFFAHPSLTPTSDTAAIEALPEFQALTRASGARLTVTTGAPEQGVQDPCILPPGGGFRSLENHLYRVEVHAGGPQTGATFKWSRDNAAVATRVVGVEQNTLTVESLGRDAVLRIRQGDWVELTDDLLEAARVPGVMAKVAATDDEERTVVLHAALADLLAARPDVVALGKGAFPNLDPAAARHTRVRRWDQNGQVVDDEGALLVDLGDPASGGVIPVPAPGRFVVLESGIKVAWNTDASADYHPFDAWTFAARAADGTVEELKQAPPQSDHHHFALLGLVTQDSATVSDLRVLWPPETGGGDGCCTIHVTPDQHNGGSFTIQQALDQLRTGGGTLCLDAGVYRITDAILRMDGARGVTIRGQGPQTILARQVVGPLVTDPPKDDLDLQALKGLSLLQITNSLGVTLQDLVFLGSGDLLPPASQFVTLLRVSTCAGLVIERCTFINTGDKLGGPGLVVRGVLAGATIRDNVFLSSLGIVEEFERLGAELFTSDLRIERNLFQCLLGIVARRDWYFTGQARIADNRFVGSRAIQASAISPDSTLEIVGNHFDVGGLAVESAASRLAIRDNTFLGKQLRANDEGPPPLIEERPEDSVAIRLDRRNDPAAPESVEITGNTIRNFTRGVEVLDAPYERIVVRGNHLHDLREHGILVGASQHLVDNRVTFGDVTIADNHLHDLGGFDDPAYLVGIGVHGALATRVEGNTIERFGAPQDPPGRPWSTPNSDLRAISVARCMDASVRGNRLVDCGPLRAGTLPGDGVPQPLRVDVTGLRASAVLQRLDCADNHLLRSDYRGAALGIAALRIDDDTQQLVLRVQDKDGRSFVLYPDRIVQDCAAPTVVVAGNRLQAVLATNNDGNREDLDPASHHAVDIATDGLLLLQGNLFTFANLDSVSPLISLIRSRAIQAVANTWAMNQPTEAASARFFTATPPVALGNLFFHCTSSAPFAVPGLLNLDTLPDRKVL